MSGCRPGCCARKVEDQALATAPPIRLKKVRLRVCLTDHLDSIGTTQRRDIELRRLRGLVPDDQLEGGIVHDSKIRRFGSFASKQAGAALCPL
jgi:hypothetical protein